MLKLRNTIITQITKQIIIAKYFVNTYILHSDFLMHAPNDNRRRGYAF